MMYIGNTAHFHVFEENKSDPFEAGSLVCVVHYIAHVLAYSSFPGLQYLATYRRFTCG